MSSLGPHGTKDYGKQLIQELETMYAGIGKKGMGSMSFTQNKLRASTQKALEKKLRALYKAGKYADKNVDYHLKQIQKKWDASYRTIK